VGNINYENYKNNSGVRKKRERIYEWFGVIHLCPSLRFSPKGYIMFINLFFYNTNVHINL
jgi:hypothetical protein